MSRKSDSGRGSQPTNLKIIIALPIPLRLQIAEAVSGSH